MKIFPGYLQKEGGRCSGNTKAERLFILIKLFYVQPQIRSGTETRECLICHHLFALKNQLKSHFHSGHILTHKMQTAPSSHSLSYSKGTCWKPTSLVWPPCSHLYELTAVRAALVGGGGTAVGMGGRAQGERGAKGEEECQLPSASHQETFLFQRGSLPLPSELHRFFKGSFCCRFSFLPLPSKQNSVLHFLSNRRDPTLEVESKGRKAITSVLVIKRICIMNHMPKGPVLHVGQIFVWIFNFYIQMKHSVQSINSVR